MRLTSKSAPAIHYTFLLVIDQPGSIFLPFRLELSFRIVRTFFFGSLAKGDSSPSFGSLVLFLELENPNANKFAMLVSAWRESSMAQMRFPGPNITRFPVKK